MVLGHSVKSRSSFEAKVRIAFGAAVIVVLALTAVTWKVANDAKAAASRVARTHAILSDLAHIRGDTLQIELSTQSFRISGDPAYLVERDATIANRETLLLRVKTLTAGTPYLQEHWASLRSVLDERLAISRRVEALRKSEGLEAANAYVARTPLKETRERTHRLLHEMEIEENRLLGARTAEQLHSDKVTTRAGALVALSLCALLSASYLLIRSQLRESRTSQQALSESEENLSTTLQSIGDAVLATDTSGRITRMNIVAERLTGWTISEARGHSVDEVIHLIDEQTRAPAVVLVAKVLETNERQGLAGHTVLIARDGRECPISDSAAPIRDNAGRVHGVVLVFRDVTVEQKAQRTILEQKELLEQLVRERTTQLHESEDHLRSVIRAVPALIAYVDAEQRYVYANEQYRERFAPDRSHLTGATVRDVLGEDRYAIAAPLIAQALQGQSLSYDWQPFPGVWQVIHYAPKRDAEGQVAGYYVLGTDITERKHAEAKIQSLNLDLEQHVHKLEHVSRALRTLSAGNRTMLRATEERTLLSNMCEAIVTAGGYDTAVVWYRIDDDAKTMWAEAESGYPMGMAALQSMKVTWADDAHGRGAVGAAIRSNQTCVVRDMPNDANYSPWRTNLHQYASVIACPLRVRDEVIGVLAIYDAEPNTFDADEVTLLTESADDLAFGIATLRTRAEQRRTEAALHHLTRYDALTGLPNEMQFSEVLTSALADGQRDKPSFALLQADIERLSEINDALGFHHGDQMLKEFGSRLRNAAPASAIVARLRGDEFAILLPGGDAAAAISMTRRLQDALAQPFLISDIPLEMSAKIGVALFPEHGATPHDLYRHMDIAVHEAKKRGAGHLIFDPIQIPDQSHRLSFAGELRRAIQEGDLQLYLQPKVEMATGMVRGAEGLVRWRHAQRGLIPPSEFIGLAEHIGLIKPLTEWVIAAALRSNRALDGHAMPIAVNLSARNLREEDLVERILHLCAQNGAEAHLLELEITESTIMEDAEFALHVLHGLRTQGIPLYIDDFGTGYSSLSYLQKLPVEYIKIDQSFVRDIATCRDSALIVRSTIDLAHDLGRKVVAEGVETQAAWDLLAELGCDFAQGYFIAKPMAADEFPAWLQNYRPPISSSAREYQGVS